MKFYMWSFLHYFMIISPFVFVYILHILSKNKSMEEKRKIGIILSIIAVVILLSRNIEIFVRADYKFNVELVPYQVCHIANFVLLYAFIKKSDIAFGVAFLFNMIFAYFSLVFADGLENYSSIINFRGQAYIWGHIIIVVISLYAFIEGFVKVDLKKLLKIDILLVIFYLLSVIINNLFRIYTGKPSNYYYTHHAQSGTPLEILWNLGKVVNIGAFEVNIVYVILLGLFGLLIEFALYLLFFELPKLWKKKI